ncbi:hypothetical protein [Massilia cavernae]|nr:hypothetical protein [Massilia cavernae]
MPSITLAQLLAVEDVPDILDFRCAETGILLWPHVRTVFMRMAMSDLLYGTPLDGSVSKGVPPSRAIATFGRSVVRNALLGVTGQSRADVCMLSTGIGNQLVDGKLLNRLSDHFALAYPRQTITVEDHFHWHWPGPRHNRRMLMHAPLQARNALEARLRVRDRHVQQAARLIELVSARGARLLGWSPGAQREQVLISMLARKIAGMPQQLRSYEAMLNRIQPKVLLLIGACYGPSATLIRAARDQGVVTVEYQHGTIAPGHDGYNFGAALQTSADYRASLPEHFLSYGTWWNDRINAPVRMTEVGNPHRDFRLARMGTTDKAKNTILILADGTEFGIYVDLSRQLARQTGRDGLRVVIRPHPLERVVVAAQYGRCIDGTIHIDQNDDLYTSVLSAHVVVSELSTGLFEAAGIADKLFMWDTPKARFCFPVLPFESFRSAQELVGLLENEAVGRLPANQRDGMWASGWLDNYAQFLNTCGVPGSMPSAEDVHV